MQDCLYWMLAFASKTEDRRSFHSKSMPLDSFSLHCVEETGAGAWERAKRLTLLEQISQIDYCGIGAGNVGRHYQRMVGNIAKTRTVEYHWTPHSSL